ncbi:hypothetical protein FHO69_22260 [Vibrio vulnificus]|nr:hypothetical protein [Vibrio vulnificus]
MIYQNRPNIVEALNSFDTALNTHNSTFDEARQIFTEVETKLKQLNADYWSPYYLTPQPHLVEYVPAPISTLLFNNEPFDQITYHLGFVSGRLVLSKVTSKFEYIRDAYGNVLLAPNNIPHMNKVHESIDAPFTVTDSSRAMRVMAIEHLPGFLTYISNSLTAHTNTLTSTLNSIKSSW